MAFHLLLEISPASSQHTRVPHRAITWLREVNAMGWRDRVGWGEQQDGGLRWTNKPGAVGCPTQAPHEPTHPLRGCSYTAQVLRPSLRCALPPGPLSREQQTAPPCRLWDATIFRRRGCRPAELSPFLQLCLPPTTPPEVEMAEGRERERSLCRPCPSCTPLGVPTGFGSLPPAPAATARHRAGAQLRRTPGLGTEGGAGRGFQLAASGTRLGQTGTGRI